MTAAIAIICLVGASLFLVFFNGAAKLDGDRRDR